MLTKDYVTFYSPGTFIAEETTREIGSWHVETAVKMARDIKERHCATPYGFQFVTRTRKDDDMYPKDASRSGMYYLGGVILTLDDVRNRNDPADAILISNMECNGWERIIISSNSYKIALPFNDGDTLLDF